MHGEQFARLETQALRSTGKLEKIGHATQLTAELDDVAALHARRGDLDRNGHCIARCQALHWGTSVRSLPLVATVWHEQLHAS